MSDEVTRQPYCPECGHQNPAQARFCMNCGHSLAGYPPLPAGERRTAPAPSHSGGTDWVAIAATALAAVGLSHLSRKARNIGCLALFFLLFFGGPMACGLVMFLAESLGRLFQ